MPRDVSDQGLANSAPRRASELVPAGLRALKVGWLGLGLRLKLLLLTATFVMLAAILIFLPSMSSFRTAWLTDRLTAAYVSSLAAEAVPGGAVPPQLRNELVRTALVRAVAIRRHGQRRLVLPPVTEITVDESFDLRPHPVDGLWQNSLTLFEQIGDALAVFTAPDDRTIRVIGPLGPRRDDIIEIVLPEGPLRRAMVQHGLNLFGLSIAISLITAALVYVSLSSLLVRPLVRLTRNMLQFSRDPEDTSRIITPSNRTDEVGTAERELAAMQSQLSQLLLQKNRLAQLGLVVSKINHDLRNMLANAQLISDRLTALPDPTVQLFAPKLIASLDRAINFCNDTLRFGRAEEAAPRRDLMLLKPLVEEVGDSLGLPREGLVTWRVDIPDKLRIDADRDHLFRVLSNLCRNAQQAIESLGEDQSGEVSVFAHRDGRLVTIEVRDTGPGVPPQARDNLFRPFQASFRKGGTGLGLTIASELIAAHGGALTLIDVPHGAMFRIELPDRAVS